MYNMNKNITLSEFIKELQMFEKEFGDKNIRHIGSCCGTYKDIDCPFTLSFDTKDNGYYEIISILVASKQKDIGKSRQ